MAYNDGVQGPGPVDTQTVTIASSGTTSGVIDVGMHKFMAILIPSAFTGTSVSFTGSVDNTNFADVYDDAGSQLAITVPTANERWVTLQSAVMAKLAPFRWLKLVGSAQGAARTIKVALK